MALWIFQMVFNLIMAALAVGWLIERRRARMRRPRPAPVVMTALPSATSMVDTPAPAVETPLRSPISTLKERPESTLNPSNATNSAVEAYDKADRLLGQGIPLREVARQTGLSLAELQLIGKMSQKSQ